MIVENLDRLVARLDELKAKINEGDTTVVVGYTQSYGIYVHENLEADHKPGKRAKFLEEPARQLSNDGTIGRIVRKVYRETKSLKQGLLVAGLRIQRESQKIVPIDTGALKSSAFTAYESDVDIAAATALSKSEAVRARTIERRIKRK